MVADNLNSPVFVVFTVLGGLVLFLLGMNMLADGLREAAGDRLRSLLSKAGKNRLRGAATGTLSGVLIQSSATTVMLVAFVNAGLLSLLESLPLVFGANVGTTISMQLISFKLGHYCFFAIAIGFVLRLASKKSWGKGAGNALIGFGLLFLGMNVMSDAIRPFRDELQPFLQVADASTIQGMLLGILASTLITAIIQSSGATIGMCFALISAGAFGSLSNVFPVILGAHLGTCITALLGSIGTNIDARRCALSHLMFNLFNVILAIPLSQPLMKLAQATSSDMVRQSANLNTFFSLLGFIALLPITPWFARFLKRITPSESVVEMSHLDRDLLKKPEEALHACLLELQRVGRLCENSFSLSGELLLMQGKTGTLRKITSNEKVVDEIKTAMRYYLSDLTKVQLSKRQAILLQHVDCCMVEIERISDHIDSFSKRSVNRTDHPQAVFEADTFEDLCLLFAATGEVIHAVAESFSLSEKKKNEGAELIFTARENYIEKSIETKARFLEKMEQKSEAPLAGMFFRSYVAGLDRIVRHAKIIASTQQQSYFWIKSKKLGKVADPAKPKTQPELVDPDVYRKMLAGPE